MSFGFVKTSVKVAVLNALNISGLDEGTTFLFVESADNAEEQ